MILETLDVKKNDIFIYSENKLNLKTNFKLISKDSIDKNPKAISFNEVCKYIEYDVPKNLIIYRLLTNLPSYDLTSFKYGFPLSINGEKEIIHFDPCFAINDLEEFVKEIDFKSLRFRIQQVGLIYYMRSFGRINYSEVYSFDMEANEAKWQNDRVFAELIFAFDEIDFSEGKESERVTKIDYTASKPIYASVSSTQSPEVNVEVDKQFNPVDTKKLSLQRGRSTGKRIEVIKPETFNKMFSREETETGDKKKASPSAFSSFLDRVKKSSVIEPEELPNEVNQSAKQFKDFVKNRQKEQFVLKFKGK